MNNMPIPRDIARQHLFVSFSGETIANTSTNRRENAASYRSTATSPYCSNPEWFTQHAEWDETIASALESIGR